MNQARHDESATSGRSLPWVGILAALAAAAILFGVVQSFRQSAAATSDMPFVSGWWLGLAIGSLLVMSAAFFLARRYRLRQRHIAARIHNTQLVDLLDVWFWQTDNEFRLTTIRPPLGAPDQYWLWAQATGTLIWDLWPSAEAHADQMGEAPAAESVAKAMLSTRLRARAPIVDARVQWQQSGETSGFWLRGVPRYDLAGRFIGFEGTLRRADAASKVRAIPSAVPATVEMTTAAALNIADAVMRSLPSPASLLEWGATDQSRLVLRLNAEAASYFQHMEYAPSDLPVAALHRGAPNDLGPRAYATLAEAVSELLHDAPSIVSLGRPHAIVKQIGSTEAEVKLIAQWPESLHAPWILVNWRCRNEDEQQALRDEQEAFSYAVSHDLRAPLRVVEGFTRILKEDYGRVLDRIGNDHLERVLGAAARMNSMIDALLAQAKLSRQPMARQPVNLSQLAAFVIDDLRKESPDRLIDIEIAPGMQVDGDPVLLRVVLENLLGNAWKYSSKKARARMEFCREQKEGQSGQWVYVVKDNGVGFDMRYADRLFGMFQRLHSANDYHGTGVGLASVRRIIHRHGGQIWAESEVDQGSSFYFTLDASHASAH